MSLVFIIEDEPIMAECMALAADGINASDDGEVSDRLRVEIFYDAISAMDGLRAQLPDAILLDVMLVGPDGFAFLNEMVSYTDTARIPVILVTTLDLSGQDLSHYGVVHVLNKATMTPEDIRGALYDALRGSSSHGASQHDATTGLVTFNQQLGSETK